MGTLSTLKDLTFEAVCASISLHARAVWLRLLEHVDNPALGALVRAVFSDDGLISEGIALMCVAVERDCCFMF